MEFTSPLKHEFLDGTIFMMRRCDPSHCTITLNVASQLRAALKGRDGLVFSSMMRVRCPTGLYTYPDVMATPGQPSIEKCHNLETATKPSFIAEVFPPATEAYDRGRKFEHYQTIPSLRSYMLVAQERPRIEIFIRRAEDQWQRSVFEDLGDRIMIPEHEVTISLTESYEKVDFFAS